MKPLTAGEIFGNWATLLLPINADDSIDFSLLEAEVDHFIATQVNGVYSNGSAGEFYSQTEAEFDQVSVILAERCERAGLPFQIGACHMSPQLSRERVRRTKALRPGAFQVILPDWFSPTLDEIIGFLDAMAEAADPIPLIVYNPPHAKRQLNPAEWREILERVRGIVGMKVPGGDAQWYQAMQPVLARCSVFTAGHRLADALPQGARGAYSNVACLSPAGAQEWYDLCIQDPSAGQQLGQTIYNFWTEHVAPLITQQKLPNMAADKAAAVAGGWLPGLHPRLRWPYHSASPEHCAAIRAAAKRALPGSFFA
ncbi:MAG: dihydrodipicolinate synthase family protein [Opitutus sp.]